MRRAAEVLRAGGVVAVPTETVYGLAADAHSDDAVARVFAAKGRPPDNPLIVHVADAVQAERLVAPLTPLARRLAGVWWPGPLTVVVPAELPSSGRPLAAAVTAGLDTVAIRASSQAWLARLLADGDVVVAAPSANRSGRPSPTTAAHVSEDLGDLVDLVVDGGPSPIGLESTVVDARGATPVVLRDGAVAREHLVAWPGGDPSATGHASAAAEPSELGRSPGTRHRHYAPTARVEIHHAASLADRAAVLQARDLRVGVVAAAQVDVGGAQRVHDVRDVDDLARGLFDDLRRADSLGLDVLLVAAVPEQGLGRAVMDRLRRAAGLVSGDGPPSAGAPG